MHSELKRPMMKFFLVNGSLILFMALLPAPAMSDNALNNGSFEDDLTGWIDKGFEALSSVTDSAGKVHLPTDGRAMVGLTDSYGTLLQRFSAVEQSYILAFDRNVVDPRWSAGDLQAMVLWLSLQDNTGKIVWLDFRIHFPAKENEWERIFVRVPRFSKLLPKLTIGQVYQLGIKLDPNMNACMPDTSCHRDIGSGTVLIDHVTLVPESEFVRFSNDEDPQASLSHAQH